MGYYQGSIAKALLHLYPDIGLDIRKLAPNNGGVNETVFTKLLVTYNKIHLVFPWRDSSNHKSFFDGIAVQHNFDPLIPTNWYAFSPYAIAVKVFSYSITVWKCVFITFKGGKCSVGPLQRKFGACSHKHIPYYWPTVVSLFEYPFDHLNTNLAFMTLKER